LTGGCTNITRGRFIHPAQNRAITDREALLLQGFPSFASVVGTAGQRALQIGNAVPPPLTEAVAKAVLSFTPKAAG
jgi:DNA (cytosine-5)-methyltransferase 1